MKKWFKRIQWKLLIALIFINIILYGSYMLINKTPFRFSQDFDVQFQTFMVRIGNYWSVYFDTGTFPLWDKSLFYGADTLGSMAYYGLGDIWTYFVLSFGASNMSTGLIVAHIIKLTIGSYLVYIFFTNNNISKITSCYLSLLYNASFWSIAVIGYINHTNYLLYVPLLLVLADKLIVGRKYASVSLWLVFTISLLNSLAYSFNFSILVFIYVFIRRWINQDKKMSIKDGLSWVAQWAMINVFAVLSSGVIVIPQLIQLMNSTRSSHIDFANTLIYIVESLHNVIAPQVAVIDGLRIPYAMQVNSFASFIVIPMILYSLIKKDVFSDNKNWQTSIIVVIVYMVILLVEPINYGLNLMTGSYQRWTLILVIFQLMTAGYVIDAILSYQIKLKPVVLTTVLLSLLSVAFFVKMTPYFRNVLEGANEYTLVIAFVVCMAMTIPFISQKKTWIVMIASMNLIASYGIIVLYFNEMSYPNQIEADYPQVDVASWFTNRGILYGGFSQQYFNSFIYQNQINRTAVMSYSYTLDEIETMTGSSVFSSLARENSPYMEYLLGIQYREKLSMKPHRGCYDNYFCLEPTRFPGPSGVVLNQSQAISLDDFKAQNWIDKARIVATTYIGTTTTVDIQTTQPVDAEKFWVKEGNWYTHYVSSLDKPYVFYSLRPIYFCVNRSESGCQYEKESTYFETDIKGIESISVLAPSYRQSLFENRMGEAPYVDVFLEPKVMPIERTLQYNWLDSNTIQLIVPVLLPDEIIMLPVGYHKDFKVVKGEVNLSEIQLGMIGISDSNKQQEIIIEYKPSYIRYIWASYTLAVIGAMTLVVYKKIKNL